MVKIEAQLWALDKYFSKKNIDTTSLSEFDIMQFASAYAHYKLYQFIYHGGNVKHLLKLVRLANLTKKELLEMMPEENKNQTRMQLYQKARKRLENGNN